MGTATRVLIVEDEPLIALDIATILAAHGHTVVGPAIDVASALQLLDNPSCDAAILDINLGHETAAPIAVAMRSRGIRFVVVSGLSVQQHSPEFAAAVSVSKPIDPIRLLAALDSVLMTVDRH
jgi:two-component system, response regulator PdtaR